MPYCLILGYQTASGRQILLMTRVLIFILGIVMEFIDGEDLQAYLLRQGGSLTEDVARFVFQQLCITVRRSVCLC